MGHRGGVERKPPLREGSGFAFFDPLWQHPRPNYCAGRVNQPSASDLPAAIEVIGVGRRFDRVVALDNVSLSVRKGEFFSLLGPSGCGKTTLLRLIAGLDHPDTGEIRLCGRTAAGWPAHQRPVNTVFQSYALFPHLTVWDNVAFGLRMKRVPAAELTARVKRVLATVQIADLANRRPAQLSGGEKQRVALARALVNEPEVLLLDEPLGALDLKLRKQLQVELHQLQRRLGITFVYVTHDQDEALTMSDRIAVMNAGRIEQLDLAERLYERPRTRFVAQFLGQCNLLEAEVERVRGTHTTVRSAVGRLDVATPLPPAAQQITLAIRPEKVLLARADELPFANCVPALVEDLVYGGAETQYRLRCRDTRLTAVALNTRTGRPPFRAGERVLCYLPEEALVVLDD